MTSLRMAQNEEAWSLDQVMEMNQTLAEFDTASVQPSDEIMNHVQFCRDDVHHQFDVRSQEQLATFKTGELPAIAICGMALRLPGGVSSPDEFWKFLIEKRDGLCEVPESRYNIESYYHESKPHSIRTRRGYFLQEDPACFDADFFSIQPAEAARMDPQQRQLLEVVWECLESAGETKWRGKDVGCFVGVYGEDWLDLASKDPQNVDRYHVLGTGQFALSNRVSYEYDFQGPSMTLQTGCSSSLVGLHEACQALYSGECSSAIVAGTNLILAPTMTTTMSENLVLSPSGICRTFDEMADGYGRGEAINAIYIKRLDDAIRSNDPIRAVIRATSTNCDGKTPGITTPGSLTQERLIRNTYKKACIENISQTAFFECHGTGTTIGDTAETSVVAKVFENHGTVIGSVKPNVGHSEGASGITSVIKTVLSLERKTIAPNIFFDSPNPKISFEDAKLKVPTSVLPWPADRLPRASVNCFGIGGANAHVILDSKDSYFENHGVKQRVKGSQPEGSRLIVVSAKCVQSLQQQIEAVSHYLNKSPDSIHDLAYTLGVRREHFQHRAFAVSSPGKPIDAGSFHKGEKVSTKLTFVFTGQGAQWAEMGKDLIDTFDSFRDDIKELDCFLQELEHSPSWTLQEELMNPNCRINKSALSQPLSTALQIGLVNLIRRMGVQPDSVVGHSSGEIAAAYAAGAITARSAITIAYYRGIVTESMDGKGAMLAVGVGRNEIAPYLSDNVFMACENSPQNVTLSGDLNAIHEVSERIQEDLPETLCRLLRVQTAYHSHHMLGPGKIYETQISSHIETEKEMLPFFSSVTSETITDPSQLGASYWRRNLQSPVLFNGAIRSILDGSKISHSFVEIGPHSALAGPLRQIFKSLALKTDPIYIPTLTRHAEDSRSQILHTVGCNHVYGIEVNWESINGNGETLFNLPSYAWQHPARYWHESRLATAWRQRKWPHHEILGVRIAESTDLEPSWRNILRLEDVPWIWDHVLQGNIVFPAAGYIAMAGEAIRQLHPDVGDYSIKNLVLKSPLLLKDDQATEIITNFTPAKITDLVDSEWYNFTIAAHDGVGWTKQCQGQVRPHFDYAPSPKEIEQRIRPVESQQWYRALDRRGLSYGPTFRGLEAIAADPVKLEANATIANKIENCSSRYALHPTVIDQCLQLMSVALTNGVSRRMDRLAIPTAIGHLYITGNAPQMQLESQMTHSSIGSLLGSSTLKATDETLLLYLDQAAFFSVQDQSAKDPIPLISEIKWSPDIDLTKSELWITKPLTSGHVVEAVKDSARLSLLYVLETAEKVDYSVPSEPHMARYRDWLVRMASMIRSGHYHSCPDWLELVMMSSEARRAKILELYATWADHPDLCGLFIAPQAVYENYSEIASGKSSALEVLMDDGRLEKLYACVGSSEFWDYPLQLIGHANPRMRVLEVGAGTGSATKSALKNFITTDGVRLYSKYVFTDISPGFTVAAQEKFSTERHLEFKVLDISKDPEQQGFEPHTFDVIIASNVLHATPILRDTLAHVKKLLAPNGKLLLNELNPEILIIDYIMGVLPGWGIGKDDNRADHPYMSPERWDRELRAAGFTGSDGYNYDLEPPFQLSFNMLSSVSPQSSVQGIVLVGDCSSSPWAGEVEARFCEDGHNVSWSTLDDEPPHEKVIVFMLDLDRPFLYDLDERNFLRLQEYLLNAQSRCIWVTHSAQIECRDSRYGLIFGFARTLRKETGIDLSIFETDTFDNGAAVSLVKVFEKIRTSRTVDDMDYDYEFAYQNDTVHVGRCQWVTPSKKQDRLMRPSENMAIKVDIGTHGILDTLNWCYMSMKDLGDDQVEMDVQYVGLNFRDILVAMGLVGDKTELGLEGSGTIRRVGCNVTDLKPGDRVVAISPGILQSRIITQPDSCSKIPDGLSLEDAATMTTVYLTAIYSLIELGSLKKGQTVLIHSACGGVGIASIQICKALGAEVFATVGTEEKVQFLMTEFDIPRNRIFNSRSKEFLTDVMRETNGRGVDVVLNSLAGDLLHASWECVAPCGKMFELGKRDFLTNGTLSMAPFNKNRTFFGIDLLSLAVDCPEMLKGIFAKTMQLSREAKVQPIRPVTKYPAAQAQEAFRYMQQGVHMGKILIEMPNSSDDMSFVRDEMKLEFSSHKSYLLVGGLGGLGRSISTWMVERGARQLIYLSRSAGKSAEDKLFLADLKMRECEAICVAGDVAQADDVQKAISKATMPLAGVIQLSMNLSDRTFSKMNFDEWSLSLSPKVKGTFNLHDAVEGIDLDFFVVLSSLCGVCGNRGQANYSAANTFLDAFTAFRRGLGLPCSALALGPVEDVGLLSCNPKILQAVRGGAARLLSETEVIEGMELAIRRSRTEQFFGPIIVGLSNTKPTSDPETRTNWVSDIRYGVYYNLESELSTRTEASSDRLKALLLKIEHDPSLLDEVESQTLIRRELGRLITQHMANAEDLDDEQTAKIAVDSLMSIEIRGWARRNLGLEVSLAEISKAGTVGNLGTVLIDNLRAKYCV